MTRSKPTAACALLMLSGGIFLASNCRIEAFQGPTSLQSFRHTPLRDRPFHRYDLVCLQQSASSSSSPASSEEDERNTSPSTSSTEVHNNNDAQLEKESFEELYADYLPHWLLQRLQDNGWTHPTQIQKAALDAILKDGLDAVVQAQTGSGKTLSFLLPVLANVDPSRAAVQALIVVPTRELGLQIGRVAKRLAATGSTLRNTIGEEVDEEEQDETETAVTIATSNPNQKIMIMTVLQGSQNRRQRAWAWADPPQIVIGTPQELCNMVSKGGIKRYNSVKYVVVDEVDACLLNNAGTMKANLSSSTLHELLSKYLSPSYDDGTTVVDGDGVTIGGSGGVIVEDTKSATTMMMRKGGTTKIRPMSQTRQTIFASATIPQHRHFMKQCVQNQWVLSKNPKHVSLQSGEQLVPPTLDHAYIVSASTEKKLAALRRILQKIYASTLGTSSCKRVLVFAEPQRPLEEMAQVLAKDLDGLLWKEVHGPEEEAQASAIVGVLRYEDSLSQRAAAIQSLIGGDITNFASWKGRAANYNNNKSTKDDVTAKVDEEKKGDNVKMRVLLSTDLAARGLDIAGITHIIQFDLASDADSYVHRSGRSGRFGASGQVVSIITPQQEFVLNRLANKLFLEMDCIARQKTITKKRKTVDDD